jgi:hypothetical protein
VQIVGLVLGQAEVNKVLCTLRSLSVWDGRGREPRTVDPLAHRDRDLRAGRVQRVVNVEKHDSVPSVLHGLVQMCVAERVRA